MAIPKQTGAHVLVIPYPAQGHMIPLLDLTRQLVNHGLTITILVTPKNLPLLTNLLSSNSSIKTLVLPFPTHPSIPMGVENEKDLPSGSTGLMICALGDLRNPILSWFQSHPSPPVAIISDMFLGWTHHLACQLSIARYVFSPSGALALSLMYYLWRDMPKLDDFSGDQADVISFDRIPNSPKCPWWQLSPLYRSYVEGDPISEFIKDGFLANRASWGLIVNSFSALDLVYLDYLRGDLGHDRVWAVGPLIPAPQDHVESRGGPSTNSTVHLFSWLDACKDHSVVYVCFGSQAMLTNKQMEALALGLEKSGVKFIWCVKESVIGHVEEGYGMIPKDFEDRVAGRGLVIKGWVPQFSILSHGAVGAFLTHCGWNSVIEGIIGGVVMVTWAMRADQFANATLVVDDLKVGLRAWEGVSTVPDPDKLGRAVAASIGWDCGMMERVMKLREEALEAIKESGSSWKDLFGLVKHISS